jgi:AAA15 family ATPase/GTPase
MYLEDAQERIDQTLKIELNAEVLYPQLPSEKYIKEMKARDNDEISELDKAAEKCLNEMDIIEKNRERREELEKEDQESME